MVGVRSKTALARIRSQEIAVSLVQLRIIPVCYVGTVGVGINKINDYSPPLSIFYNMPEILQIINQWITGVVSSLASETTNARRRGASVGSGATPVDPPPV